jgi:hypothetical protein
MRVGAAVGTAVAGSSSANCEHLNILEQMRKPWFFFFFNFFYFIKFDGSFGKYGGESHRGNTRGEKESKRD